METRCCALATPHFMPGALRIQLKQKAGKQSGFPARLNLKNLDKLDFKGEILACEGVIGIKRD